ncbi:MAG TPA: EamA family transporter, partial [Pseudomonas sp.]|nr:EamA family transporter [Pseudomonas sp.]
MTPNPLIGIALILLSGFLLASHDALSKQLALLYSVFLIVWARNLTQLVVMTIGFAPRMRLDLVRSQRPLLQVTRALSQVGISVFLLTGLRYIPLGEATAVMFLSPLFVTLLSVLLLKER